MCDCSVLLDLIIAAFLLFVLLFCLSTCGCHALPTGLSCSLFGRVKGQTKLQSRFRDDTFYCGWRARLLLLFLHSRQFQKTHTYIKLAHRSSLIFNFSPLF